MRNSSIPKLTFVKVRKIDSHIRELYDLLKSRRFNISHTKTPSFSDHKSFVLRNPYRAWFLISQNNKVIGSVYLTRDNCIGVFAKGDDARVTRDSIEWIKNNFKPLPPIKSVRAADFLINVSPQNKKLQSVLKKMKAVPIQVTYSFRKSESKD